MIGDQFGPLGVDNCFPFELAVRDGNISPFIVFSIVFIGDLFLELRGLLIRSVKIYIGSLFEISRPSVKDSLSFVVFGWISGLKLKF